MRKLCDELGILVISEGVETKAERKMLVLLGCDLLQGYHLGRPQKGFMIPDWESDSFSASTSVTHVILDAKGDKGDTRAVQAGEGDVPSDSSAVSIKS
jgi:predicted signal transduction protein with EAL and GGDEF domain